MDRAEPDPAFFRLLVHDAWFVEPIDLLDKPSVRVYESADLPGYLVFVRAQKDVPVSGATAGPATGARPERPGLIEVELGASPEDLAPPVSATKAGGTAAPQSKSKVRVAANQLGITVTDDAGHLYPLSFVPGSQPAI